MLPVQQTLLGHDSVKCAFCNNPCPYGYHGDSEKSCTCSANVVARYQKRISGPLLDRIDIHVDVPRVNYEKLSGQRLGEPSQAVRERVAAARTVQARRFKGTRLLTNADMGPAEVRAHCQLDAAGQRLMQAAMRRRGEVTSPLRRAPIPACSSWRAPSPTWPVRPRSARRTWPRRSSTARDEWSRCCGCWCVRWVAYRGAAVAIENAGSIWLPSRA